MSTRRQNTLIITKRLIILSGATLLIISLVFGSSLYFGGKLMMSWVCLMCGILGGFVSIQQRMKDISTEELNLLAKSWYQALLIPIYGGIFALVLYLFFISELLTGQFFPAFSFPTVSPNGLDTDSLRDFLTNTYPKTGQDFAKLLIWSFIAGFSERFVPQVITKLTKDTHPEEEPQ